MKRRHFLAAAGAGLAAPAFVRNAFAQGPEITLKLHHFLGPKGPENMRMLVPWAKAVEADSGGRVKIDIYPSMSLGGSPAQLFRQVADGVVDIVWVVNGYTPGLFPRSEVFELPTIFTNNIAATNLAMREMYETYLAPEYQAVHLLFNHVHAGQAITMGRTPVHSIADTRAKRLRVPGPTGIDVVKAMGATPVSMPVPDLPQALSTNVVDGALIPFEVIPALQLQEVSKYQIEGPDHNRFGTTVFQVSMNKARWASLDDDLKAVFAKNSDTEFLRDLAKTWRSMEEDGLALAVKAGNEHIVLSQTEMDGFNAVLAPVVDKWIADHPDIDGKTLVEVARKTIAKYAA